MFIVAEISNRNGFIAINQTSRFIPTIWLKFSTTSCFQLALTKFGEPHNSITNNEITT